MTLFEKFPYAFANTGDYPGEAASPLTVAPGFAFPVTPLRETQSYRNAVIQLQVGAWCETHNSDADFALDNAVWSLQHDDADAIDELRRANAAHYAPEGE